MSDEPTEGDFGDTDPDDAVDESDDPEESNRNPDMESGAS